MRLVFILLIAFTGNRLMAEENLQRDLNSLKNGTLCEKRAAVLALHRLGKKAIPALLERIDDTSFAPSSALLLANPALSYAPPGSQHDELAGVLYAYVIELILGKDAMSRGDEKSCVYLLDPNDYVYGHGLIFKGDQLIKGIDLPSIKETYLQWWEKNREKPLLKMRKDWKAFRRPLSSTQYTWQ